MKCHECGEIYESSDISHICYRGETRYFIQYKTSESLETIPERQVIIAKNLFELNNIINKRFYSGEIEILASEKI